jgi:lipoyl-dependent peroxiredoxin
MPTRSSSAEWSGNLARGNGTMSLGSGAFEGSYAFTSRFESGEGTNPEELITAKSGCAVSRALGGIEIGPNARLA